MDRRSAAVEATRLRIVEATMAAHAELGIAATSVQDVAHRADVAVGTVYRHFPRTEDLVDACGRLARDLIDLPTAERSAELFRGGPDREERVRRLVGEVARLYELGAIGFVRLRESRDALPLLTRDHAEWEGAIDRLVDAALRPLRPGRRRRAAVRSLLDARFWLLLEERGLERMEIESLLRRLVVCELAAPARGHVGGRQPPVSPR